MGEKQDRKKRYNQRRRAIKALRVKRKKENEETEKLREAIRVLREHWSQLQTDQVYAYMDGVKALGVTDRYFDVDERKGTYVENFKFKDGMIVRFRGKLQR